MDGLLEIFEKMIKWINGFITKVGPIIYKEKIKFKPVLKINSTGLYYRDKSLRNYYCRNNC